MPSRQTATLPDSEILAYCGSCKMDLAAMIVAKVGAKIVKVQCKTCKKEHAYKAAKGVADPTAAPAVKKPRKAKSEATKTVSVEVEWTRLMKEASAAKKISYNAKAKLQIGDVIAHPSFGDGIVTKTIYPDKAEILFQFDMKTLIHSK